jgi:hypothetical protein
VVAVAVLVTFVLAANPAVNAQSPEAKAKAQGLMKHGAQHYQHGDFADALAEFQAAYAAFPSPKLLLNIGQCQRELGRSGEALQAFERFLTDADAPPPRLLAEAKQAIEELSAQVGRVRIDCAIKGAEVRIDGKKVGIAPIKELLPVTPGHHELTASQQGQSRAASDVDIAAGTVETVVLKASAPREPAKKLVPRNEVIVVSRAPVANTEEGWMLGRTWTWVAAGSTIVLAGGATAAGMVMQSKYDALDRRCGQSAGSHYTGCSASDFSTLDTWKTTANVLWGLSAAAAVTTAVLFYVEGRSVEVSPTVGPQLGLAARVRY